MSIQHLDNIFQPTSIVVVGASDERGSIGAAIMDNLIQSNYSGAIYPVNPRHEEIKGLKAFPSINEKLFIVYQAFRKVTDDFLQVLGDLFSKQVDHYGVQISFEY